MASSSDIRAYFTTSQQPVHKATQPIASLAQDVPQPTAPRAVVKGSDDEESSSDTSLEDLNELLQARTTAYESKSKPLSASENSEPRVSIRRSRGAGVKKSQGASPASGRKYRFDMGALVVHARDYEATEATARRVKALFENVNQKDETSIATRVPNLQSDILEAVVAEKDSLGVEKVLQAIRRTETMIVDKSWYFFDIKLNDSAPRARDFPNIFVDYPWQRSLSDSHHREHLILSGFVKDSIALGDRLPREIFEWLLDEMCLETRIDLRRSYCSILLAAPDEIHRLVLPATIIRIFEQLGGNKGAIDLGEKIYQVNAVSDIYRDRDWTILETMLDFFGMASYHFNLPARLSLVTMLARLSIDAVIQDNLSLLNAVQNTLHHCCDGITQKSWDPFCDDLCTSICPSIEQGILQLQILRCFAPLNDRMHKLRRQLAVCFFCQESGPPHRPVHEGYDFSEILRHLSSPRFRIDEDTDYTELAARLSVLDIAVDNGRSDKVDVKTEEAELEFDRNVDQLGARIKHIWSTINDAGATFISRIDAKELMEEIRHRLIYTVRTRPKAKQSIFDVHAANKEAEAETRRQSSFMDNHFQRAGKLGQMKTDD